MDLFIALLIIFFFIPIIIITISEIRYALRRRHIKKLAKPPTPNKEEDKRG